MAMKLIDKKGNDIYKGEQKYCEQAFLFLCFSEYILRTDLLVVTKDYFV